MKKFFSLSIFILLVVLNGQAQWDGNPATVDNPVCKVPGFDSDPFSVSDGAGGLIVVWTGNKFGNPSRIYCQHITVAGVVAWGTIEEPVEVASIQGYSDLLIRDIQSDGTGGAYISWEVQWLDSSSVYLQHISNYGIPLFTAGGIRITPAMGVYSSGGKICADSNGVIICWTEIIRQSSTSVPDYEEVMLQRFNTTGAAQWGQGVAVSIVPALRKQGELVSDGNNGAFISFQDARNSGFDFSGNPDNFDLFAQHISGNGTKLWGLQDAPISTAPFNQLMREGNTAEIFSCVVADSAGGFVVMYWDNHNSNDSPLITYAQRLDSNGTRLWDSGGVRLFTPSSFTYYHGFKKLLSDGAHGIVASWDAYEIGVGESTLSLQRITAAGVKPWGENGIIITAAMNLGGSFESTLVADGTGSYVAAWVRPDSNLLKAQKINNNGQLLWPVEGVNICSNPLSFARQPVLTKSNSNFIIALWQDTRDFANTYEDFYAAKIDSIGTLVNSVVYTSIASGNWSNPPTWQGNMVPPAGGDVVIRNAVIGDANTSCSTLMVLAPGSLIINAGINITILN